jgi:hypothetical protein
MSKRAKCKTCKGAGSVWSDNINQDDENLPDYTPVRIKLPCPACHPQRRIE